jgi:hypothetical protein
MAPPFLSLALDVSGQLHAGTDWIGGWVVPRAGLDEVERRKILPHRESNPGRPHP